MKRVRNFRFDVRPPINESYYNLDVPTYPEIHKSSICQYYTRFQERIYVITYLRHKPVRWSEMKQTDLGYPEIQRWRPTDPPVLIVKRINFPLAEVIGGYEDVDDKFLHWYLTKGLANLFMEESL